MSRFHYLSFSIYYSEKRKKKREENWAKGIKLPLILSLVNVLVCTMVCDIELGVRKTASFFNHQ